MHRFFNPKNYMKLSPKLKQFIDLEKTQIPEEWLNSTFGLKAISEDLTQFIYKNPHKGSYVLARTFRSGVSNGVESELSYLRNEPGFIFANPSTVISAKIPSKTISQLPDNDWSQQPSFLFVINTASDTTIANHGIASLNSFSSSDALSLMHRLDILKNKNMNNNLTITEKLASLKIFLYENWHKKIDDVKREIELLEKRVPSISEPSEKRFCKSFNLYFHKIEKYDELLDSLESLTKCLNHANKLHCVVKDITIEDANELVTLKSEIIKHINHLSPEYKKNIKQIIFKAAESLKKDVNINNTLNPDEIYQAYCDYLDTGARHNELVSRIYPWEITGIEWGSNHLDKANAIADLIVIFLDRYRLYRQFLQYGIDYPLFSDFMYNKISCEYPSLNYS